MITWSRTWREKGMNQNMKRNQKRKATKKPPEFGCRRQWQCCQLPWEQQKPHSEKERNEHNCTPSQFHLPADYSSKAQQFCGTLRCQSLPGSCHWDLNKRVCISWDPYETNQNVVFRNSGLFVKMPTIAKIWKSPACVRQHVSVVVEEETGEDRQGWWHLVRPLMMCPILMWSIEM